MIIKFFYILCILHIGTSQRLTKFFHGIFSECDELSSLLNKVPQSECIETGGEGRSLASLIVQSEVACEKLKSKIPSDATKQNHPFKDGLNLVGFSMGGLVVELLLQTCSEVAPYVKRVIILGSPIMGSNNLSEDYKLLGIALKY